MSNLVYENFAATRSHSISRVSGVWRMASRWTLYACVWQQVASEDDTVLGRITQLVSAAKDAAQSVPAEIVVIMWVTDLSYRIFQSDDSLCFVYM